MKEIPWRSSQPSAEGRCLHIHLAWASAVCATMGLRITKWGAKCSEREGWGPDNLGGTMSWIQPDGGGNILGAKITLLSGPFSPFHAPPTLITEVMYFLMAENL